MIAARNCSAPRRHDELALLDAREQGVHYRGHPFFACSAPLSQLEMMIADLVPRKSAPIVVFDGGEGSGAEKRRRKLRELGYTTSRCSTAARAAGKPPAASSSAASTCRPRRSASSSSTTTRRRASRARRAEAPARRGKQVVILDSRPFEEYQRMCIPGGIDRPGAELAYRVHDLVRDPHTLIVVNCAGRTRSIIGCQSLRNAGVAESRGRAEGRHDGLGARRLRVGEGRGSRAPAIRARGIGQAQAAAEQVAQRFGVEVRRRRKVHRWRADARPDHLPPRRAHARRVRGGPHRRLAPRAGRPARAGDRRVRRRAARARWCWSIRSACAPS